MMGVTRKAPPGVDRRSLKNARRGIDADGFVAEPISAFERDVARPKLDAAVEREVHVYDGRESLGEIYALRTGKWVAARGGTLLGYFENQQGALNRLRGAAPHEPLPVHRGRP